MQAQKGIYAVLLGSGISRSAGIPTGWDIVEDLIERVARAQGVTSEPDRVEWFRNKFHEEPNYSRLLGALAKSPAERNQILRRYFEPNDEEREQGLKMPTVAHREIAALVTGNYVRVIVTTNFDRLMEQALEAAGITPTVIDNAEKIEGAMPLTHSRCTVIKLNGDYMDIRIKNTPEELAKYDERMDTILDRVLDDYGLVICGWSADYDIALESAISRCSSRRFTTYWAAKGALSDAAGRLIELRKAEVIKIANADQFFRELNEKISALEQLDSPHPLTAQVAVATAKRYLGEEKFEIQLHDLVTRETSRLLDNLSEKYFPYGQGMDEEAFVARMSRYEAATETLLGLMIIGCYRSKQYQVRLWPEVLKRIGNPHGDFTRSFESVIFGQRLYPALLLKYGGGMASVAAGDYRNLYSLLVETKIKVVNDREPEPSTTALTVGLVFEANEARWFKNTRSERFAANEHLFEVLRMPFGEICPQDDEYKSCFDRFEYFLSLVYADLVAKKRVSTYFSAPAGLFVSEPRLKLQEKSIIDIVNEEAKQQGDSWPPFKAGFFDGSYERFEKVVKGCDENDAFRR